MSKYKDINTGQEYDELPEDKVQPIIVKGQPVTEYAHDKYYSSHPIELEEYVIIPQQPKSTTMAAYYDRMSNLTESNFLQSLNTAHNDQRIRSANHWQGIGNMLSPGQYIGAGVDYFQGEHPFWEGVWYGNNGWVPDNFAGQYPRTSMLINAGTDLALAHGIGRFYNWGTTPKLIGEGANKRAYSAPFSRRVYFEGANPEYIKTQNNVPGALKYKLEKYDIDGQPIYSSPKVRIVSRPSKGFIKRAIKNQFFPTNVVGDTETVFINPARQQVMSDTEWGRSLFGRTYAVDPEVLSIPEYFSILKKGGKLNGNKKI